MKKLIILLCITVVGLLSIVLLKKNGDDRYHMNEIVLASKEPEKTCVNRYEVINEEEKTAVITEIKITGEKLVIPSQIEGYTVVRLGKRTENEGLLKTIGDRNKVKEVVLPETLQVIGSSAFPQYKKLEKVNFPKALNRIEHYAFAETGLQEVKFINEKIELESAAFISCENLKKVVWPQNQMTENIGRHCFAWTGLENLNYPDVKNYRQIGTRCFSGNKKLKKVFFPSTTKELLIQYNVFTECKKAQLIIPKEVKKLEYRPSPYISTIIFEGKDTRFIKLEPLVKKDKTIKGKSYLQFETVIAPRGAAVLKQVKTCYYGDVEKVSGEDLYDGEDCSYNNRTMTPVKGKAVLLPSTPSVSYKNKTLSWKSCSGAKRYEVYYAATKNGTFRKIMSTKVLKVSKLEKGYYKVYSVKKKYEVDWRSNASKVVKIG